MSKTIKCKDCETLEARETRRETNKGSGVYTVTGTHYYCPKKDEILTEQEILKKGCAAGAPEE